MLTSPGLSSTGNVAVTPHDLATHIAVDVMARGGNAVDAAIAANAVLTVVAPETCGIGGDLFALVHLPGEAVPRCLNASGRAGSNASAQELRDSGHAEMPLYHPAAITVPGCVDGWMALHAAHGTGAWRDLIGPAIEYARLGFAVSDELARTLDVRSEELITQASSTHFYEDGVPVAAGALITRPELAQTLADIAGSGRDAFYTGRFGSALIEASGNRITADDLYVDQAEWVEPIGRRIFGQQVWTVPPNTQGYVTLATLAVFELLAPPIDPDDPLFQHLLIEDYRAANFDRDDHATDPATAPLSGDELLADQRLAERAARIDPDKAGTWGSPRSVPGGTAFLCTIDSDGMGVSFIQSNFHGIGSGFSAGDTGVWLHNRGGGFSLEPGHPNELVPGRRPLHTLAPTLWTTPKGRLSMLLGTRGGRRQPQLLAQVAAAIHHAGASLTEAQERSRWALEDDEGDLLVEPGLAASAGLAERGHRLDEQPERVGGWGPVSVIAIDEDGQRRAAADPRVATASARATAG
jgi:gamma-glutamyltranspeptidase/glutathione hydrolase